MLWDKIINPETGKTVTIRSNKGMEILRNYVDVMKGGAAKTPSKNQAPPKNKLTPPDKKLKPKGCVGTIEVPIQVLFNLWSTNLLSFVQPI